MKLYILTLCVISITVDTAVAYCDGRRWQPGPLNLDVQGIIKRSFSVTAAIEESQGKDMVCSPLSGLLPIAQLALGTSNGPSLHEMEIGLGMTKSNIDRHFSRLMKELKNLDGIQLDIASKLFIAEHVRVKNSYEDILDKTFDTKLKKIDFQQVNHAVTVINDWVSSETQGNIPSLVNSAMLKGNTKLVAVNAVYFKGKWAVSFNKAKLESFFSSRGKITVPMMSRFATYAYTYSPALFAKIVAIPYENGCASMVIVLPDEMDGLTVMLHKLRLAPELLQDALKGLKSQKLNLKMPKFRIETTLNMRHLYEKLGINDIFTRKSDLTEIVDEPLSLDTIIQKAVIEVTEQGTEAAAATAALLMKMAFVKNRKFFANHPFYYVIIAGRQQLFSGVFTASLNKRY